MKNLVHPNVVLLLGVFISAVTGANNIVMELCYASLSVFTDKESPRNLNRTEVAFMMHGLHEGLNYLHSRNIIHRSVVYYDCSVKDTKHPIYF